MNKDTLLCTALYHWLLRHLLIIGWSALMVYIPNNPSVHQLDNH